LNPGGGTTETENRRWGTVTTKAENERWGNVPPYFDHWLHTARPAISHHDAVLYTHKY